MPHAIRSALKLKDTSEESLQVARNASSLWLSEPLDDLEAIVRGFPHLKVLILKHAPSSLEPLRRLANLKSLRVAGRAVPIPP